MTNPMTPRQTDFINTLLRERDVDTAVRNLATQIVTSLEASLYINTLLKYPKLALAANSALTAYRAALADAEVSKYAVPTRYLTAYPALNLTGDLLFLEVRNYNGRKYFARLSGAPGRFSRRRLPLAEGTALLKLIHGRHVEFARLFSQHYKVCGRCAADLTDQESRESGFGPTCRKVFGL